MKIYITTVGTSALEKAKISTENFSDEPFDYFDSFKADFQKKKKLLLEHFSKIDLSISNNLSLFPAEVKSLVKIGIEKGDFLYLIVSDTASCRLCGEFLKEFVEEKFACQVKLEPIKGLQVKNLKLFEEGMSNLVETINEISQNHYKQHIILNITGGFKATIPYLTVIAQLFNLPLYYVFEETENIIIIPPVPLDINWHFFKNHREIFAKLDGIDSQWNETKKKIPWEEYEKMKPLIYEFGNDAELSPLGKILWNTYKIRYFVFWTRADIKDRFERDFQVQEILKKFAIKNFRDSNSQPLPEYKPFKVYKHSGRGEDIVRIIYKEENCAVYISHIFTGREVHGSVDYMQVLSSMDWEKIVFDHSIEIEL
ncbi:MAG: putative CRISPR-associated protein [Candidatus Omnitrophica bacterium]|nr:putative CRISPR-associated protein [Candidatus Omnitrophota bacterium]